MAEQRTDSPRQLSPWARTRTAIEVALLLIGVPTAVVTFLALLPQAWETTHQRAGQYASLRGLHAGYTLDKFKSVLGEPTLVTANGALAQYTFLGDEFAVTASVEENGAVVAYGVLACNPGFQPTFDTPGATTIRLNASPLASAEQLTEEGRELVGTGDHLPDDDILDIARFYASNATAGSDNLVIEPGINSEAGSTGAPYAMGVTDACGADTAYASITDLGSDYEPTEDARPSIEEYRRRVAPNFYAESVFATLRPALYGACFSSYVESYCARPVVGRIDLPRDFRAHPDKEWWQNLWPHS